MVLLTGFGLAGAFRVFRSCWQRHPNYLGSCRRQLVGSANANFDLWETAKVDPHANFDGPPPVRIVFGYGSMIFKPGFHYEEAFPACVRGYGRRFWQRSCDHRGTPDSPGRVLTLVQAEKMPEGEDIEVNGMAYQVAEKDWQDVIKALDFRERHGYVRTVENIYAPHTTKGGAGKGCNGALLGRAVVYYAHDPERSLSYVGPELISETAAVIASAAGPSGRNDEYLFKLEAALLDNGLPLDPYLADLAGEVRRLQQASL